MAIVQTETWRKREAINKKIERQIREGWTPLTRFKTMFPYTENGDIIDRRTGKVKTFSAFVSAAMKEAMGGQTRTQFVAKLKAEGLSESSARKVYATHKAERMNEIREDYARKVDILAGMDITSTRETRQYNKDRIDEVITLFLGKVSPTATVKIPDPQNPSKTVTVNALTYINETLDKLSYPEKLDKIRQARDKSRPGKKYNHDFYTMLAEVLGVSLPMPRT